MYKIWVCFTQINKNHVKLKSKSYRIHHQHFNNLTSYLLISFTDAEPIF